MGDALRIASSVLADAGVEGARAEARLLLAHAAGLTPAQVFSREGDDLGEDEAAAFDGLVNRRRAGEPLAYIVGEREFWSLPFRVTPATLIPRADTETLVELALSLFAGRPAPARILDLGTGSGCLLLALLSEFPDAIGHGLDISDAALDVARCNALALGFDSRCTFAHASWTEGVDGVFDLIVSNPPYIRRGDIDSLDKTVREYEPAGALDGGEDGLDAYRSLLPMAAAHLPSDGALIVEAGAGQSDEIASLGAAEYLIPGPRRPDLSGVERAVSFYKKGVGIAAARG